jgi:hypothetical protein
MKIDKKTILNGGWKVLLSAGITIAASLITAQTASADVSCGSIQCTVGSQQTAVGSETGGGGGTGTTPGGGGGGTVKPKYTSVYTACVSWYGLESGGWQAQQTYPDPEAAGAWNCRFERQMSDHPKNLPQCGKTGDGRVAYGRYDMFLINPDGSKGEYKYFYCVYPTKAYLTPKVTTIKSPTGGIGDFYHVGAANMTSQYGTSGTKADSTGYRTTSFNRAAPSVVGLDQSFNAKTLVINGQPSYGFYRVQWKIDMAEYRRSIWPSWLGKADTFAHVRDYSTFSADAYTYGCNLNPALISGVRNDAIFDPSECARTTWQCDIRGEITHLGTAGNVQVMRDGSHIPVTFPTFGVVGNGVRNITKQQTYTGVDTNTVSPVNGVGSKPDYAKQYFQSNWNWNSWQAYEPTKERWVAFYWASENGKTFNYAQQYRFTGEFYVPAQGSIGGGSATDG